MDSFSHTLTNPSLLLGFYQKIFDIASNREQEKLIQLTSPVLETIQNRQKEKDIEETIALIDSWETKYTTEEIHETLEKLKKGIDED